MTTLGILGSLSIAEILTAFTALGSLFGIYYTLKNDVKSLEERNKVADKDHAEFQKELKIDIERGQVELNTKYSILEGRLRSQEHSWIRFDEKLNNIQKVLEELKTVSRKET